MSPRPTTPSWKPCLIAVRSTIVAPHGNQACTAYTITRSRCGPSRYLERAEQWQHEQTALDAILGPRLHRLTTRLAPSALAIDLEVDVALAPAQLVVYMPSDGTYPCRVRYHTRSSQLRTIFALTPWARRRCLRCSDNPAAATVRDNARTARLRQAPGGPRAGGCGPCMAGHPTAL